MPPGKALRERRPAGARRVASGDVAGAPCGASLPTPWDSARALATQAGPDQPEASDGAAQGAVWRRPAPRPLLFGVAELDNAVADGGLAPGALHVVEAIQGGPAEEAILHGAAAAAFAAGFGARADGGACWLGPPADLLGCGAPPLVQGGRSLPVIETCWEARSGVSAAMVPARVLVLDARRAHRLSPPVRFARAALKQGRVVVFLAPEAGGLVARLGSAPTCWRVGHASAGVQGTPDIWRVELARGEAVRRVLVSACDRDGRMAAAPRASTNSGKEMMRRFAQC